MNKTIIQPIETIFRAADERNWNEVISAMNETVLLDYSAMNGNRANLLSSEQITTAWASFVPGFDKTYHQLFDCRKRNCKK